MRKIILSIVGSMLIGFCVHAQQYDTAGTASKSKNKQNKQQYEKSQKERGQERQAWKQESDKSQSGSQPNEGMVIIDKDEIPASLKETLQQEKYAGWENGTIYHNTNTGEYVIAPRAYRFNEQGEEIDPGNFAYGNRDTRQNRNNESRQDKDPE